MNTVHETSIDNLQVVPLNGVGQLVKAVNAVMTDCGYVQKGGRNPEFNYTFVSDTDVLSLVNPSMVKHGLAMFPIRSECQIHEHNPTRSGKTQWRAELKQTWLLAHKSGQSIQIESHGCGLDMQDKMVPKAQTAAQKYALKLLVMFATGDDPEYVSPAELAESQKKADVGRSVTHRDEMIAELEACKDLAALKSTWGLHDASMKSLGGQITKEDIAAVRAAANARKDQLK